MTTPAGFGFTATAEAVLLQPDAKLVAVGSSSPLAFSDVVLVRYSGANGALDAGFGTGGKVEESFGRDDYGYDAALLPDGKILVAGSTNLAGTRDFLLARFEDNGALDATFGSGGRAITDFSGRFDEAYALVVQPDGKIVLAGTSAPTSTADAHLVLARYDAAGVLDPGFGTGGRAIVNPTATADMARDLVRQADGKLVVVGATAAADLLSGGVFSVLRLDAGGALDATFGTGGLVTSGFGANPAIAHGAVLQPDGFLVAAGVGRAGFDDDFALARYETTIPVSSCALAGSTLSVDLIPGDSARVVVSGSDINVLAPGIGDPTCGGATITNVDLIDVDGAAGNETLTIDLTGGPFMPGGPAGDAQQPPVPEIEWDVNLGGGAGDELVITSSDGGDTIRLGSAGINLNNDDDADVAPVAGVELVTVNGGLGNDILHGHGAFGADAGPWNGPLHLNGEGGADKLTGGVADDDLDGAVGNDTLSALKGADGTDVYRGGSGVDSLTYSTRVGNLSITLDGTANDGAAGENDDVREVETIAGGKGNDLIDGGAATIKNTFRGGAGDDQLFGGGGADQLIGEAGADLLNGGTGKDTLRATDGAGTDTLSGGPDADTCFHDAGDTVLDC